MLGPLLWSAAMAIVVFPIALWGVSLDEAWRVLRQADWRPVVVAMGLYAVAVLAKPARWQALFEPARPPFGSLCAALCLGVAVNFVLPGRLGEVARVYVLNRRRVGDVAHSVGTVAAEKLIDLGALGLLAIAAAPFLPRPM